MAQDGLPASTQRATESWERLCLLNGVSVGAKQTGWDRLAQAVLDDPTVRLRLIPRLEAIVRLSGMLSQLREVHFSVLALRLGLTVDDQPLDEKSRREVSESLRLSTSRIAQLEQESVAILRSRLATDFPDISDYVHRVP